MSLLAMTNNDKGKSTITVKPDTFAHLDGMREVYGDGTKEKWDHFLKRLAESVPLLEH